MSLRFFLFFFVFLFFLNMWVVISNWNSKQLMITYIHMYYNSDWWPSRDTVRTWRGRCLIYRTNIYYLLFSILFIIINKYSFNCNWRCGIFLLTPSYQLVPRFHFAVSYFLPDPYSIFVFSVPSKTSMLKYHVNFEVWTI